jgi:hypothetical protein
VATKKKPAGPKEHKDSFSKLFSVSGRFVTLQAKARSSDDYSIGVTIYDGNDKASIWLSEWDSNEENEFLNAVQEAVNRAVTFRNMVKTLPERMVREADVDDIFATLRAKRKKDPVKAS